MIRPEFFIETLRNFGIDFYMDKLVDILGSSYSDDSYAFLADASGYIINHPDGRYQMSTEGRTNILTTPYSQAEADGGEAPDEENLDPDKGKSERQIRDEITGQLSLFDDEDL